jgi:transposase-like protein
MKQPMYCAMCGTYFIVEPKRGQRLRNFECPTCERSNAAKVGVNTDKGVCILANTNAYPTGVHYQMSQSGIRKAEQ